MKGMLSRTSAMVVWSCLRPIDNVCCSEKIGLDSGLRASFGLRLQSLS